jgi:hypothetical protein
MVKEVLVSEAKTLKINRAPVLTLWATIVAERLGFDHDEALTLGRAVAGLNAQSKGKRLGIFQPDEENLKELRNGQSKETVSVELLHRAVPVVTTPDGVRALEKGKPSSPASAEKYLASKFGSHLAEAEKTMSDLAKSYSKQELASLAYTLYEKFRPEIPEGVQGWGAKGILDLSVILQLRRH